MKRIFLVMFLSSVSVLTGCSSMFSSYKKTSDEQLAAIYAGNAKNAMSAQETSDPLYNMEYGSLMRLTAQNAASSIYYGRAQQSMDIWANSWSSTTSGQVGSAAVSMLLNDNANGYQAKGYEKSFLATFYALNFLNTNDFDNARVEIKRMYELEEATQNYNAALYNQEAMEQQADSQDEHKNYLYQEIMKKYDFSDINSPKVLALKNSYQNAFSHYLAGFVFEALNEPSLARPGYVKAGQLNPTTSLIQKSIDNLDSGVHAKAGYTDLLIVEEVGHAPQIQSMQTSVAVNFNLMHNARPCMNMINIFYPKLVMDTNNQASYSYQLDARTMTPVPMVDVNLMSARALKDETPHLIARNVAAALRNIIAAQSECKVAKDQGTANLLNFGTALTSHFIDRADERTWSLLPSKININRISLPYGKHTITLQVNGTSYTQDVVLSQPYQILDFRIMGNQVFFNIPV